MTGETDVNHTEMASSSWQPLPEAARVVYRLTGMATLTVIALMAATFPALAQIRQANVLTATVIIALTLLLAWAVGAWLGGLRHRRTHYHLDHDGLHLRQGICWHSETVVPRSRVQHIDLERGPLLRRLGLVTLVVHTAGTRLSAVRVVGLKLAQGRQIRDALVDREAAGDDDAV